jgi:hypothetical protein
MPPSAVSGDFFLFKNNAKRVLTGGENGGSLKRDGRRAEKIFCQDR